jgi:hemolysin activation/secretion protein
MIAALLAIWTAAAPARAGLDTADPPTGAFNSTEGPRYWISLVEVRYAQEHPLQPPIDLVQQAEYALGRAPDGYVGARRGGDNLWFGLDQLGADGPLPVYATGLRDLCEQIVAELGDRGLIGVFVAPDPTQIDSQTGTDLRPEGQMELTLVIHTGRVHAVRTFAAGPGEALAGVGAAPSNEPNHEEIASRSPLQPVGAGDPLAKNELDAYVAALNRHPGRMVDVVITPTLQPGVVNLDYVVEEDKPWVVSTGYSDSGTASTGHGRQRFGYANFQVSGHDDVLLFDYVTHNFDDVNATVGSYEVNLPFMVSWANTLRARATGSWSQYRADEFGLTDAFKGDQWEAGGALVANLMRSSDLFFDASLGARWMNIDVENFDTFSSSMPFFVPELALTLERLRPASRISARLSYEQNIPFVAGTDSQDIDEFSDVTRDDIDQDWRLVALNVGGSFYLRPLFQPATLHKIRPVRPRDLIHEIAWRLGGQYSLGTRLIPQVEGVLGGMGTVRGYPNSIASGDSLFGGSVEYRFHLPLALRVADAWHLPMIGAFRPAADASYRMPDWDLVLATFFDYGQVWNAHKMAGENDDTLASLGLGIEIVVRRNFSLRLDYGFALADVESEGVEAGDAEAHFNATMRY